MARIDVNFTVEKQILTQTPETYLYTGSQDYFYAIFNVDATWGNVDTIKALFIKNGVSKIVELEKCDGGYGCDIPWQMYSTTGDFKVSIYDGERMSTNSIYVVVDEKDEIEVEEPVAETYADRLMSHFSLREVDRPDTFKIDGESRTITPPDSFDNFGVESDENTNRVWFEVPQYVGDGIDLLSLNLYVNFENANGEKDKYLVKDADATDGVLYFSWLISRKATQYKGDLKFIVCAIRTDDKGEIEAEWNTTLCTGSVLEGLEVENPAEQEETSDLVNQLIDLTKEALIKVEDAISLADKAVKSVNDCACKIVNSAEGVRISLGDNDYRAIEGLTVYGKTKQKATPSINNPQELQHGSVVVSMHYSNNNININIPGGLAGVPVTSGGNYTDSKGQQWFGDIYDYKNLRHEQHIETITFSDDREYKLSGLDTYAGYYYFYSNMGYLYDVNVNGSLCDKLPTKHYETAWTDNSPGEFCTIKPSYDGSQLIFCVNVLKTRVDKYSGSTSLEKFNNFMKENPLIIQVAHTNPIKYTNIVLTEAEKEQYKEFKLKTPFTVVYNDVESYMKIEYVADTKAYIDRKIAEVIATMSSGL